MLTSNKKRIVKEVLSYFIDTTGVSEDMFILSVQRNRTKSPETLDYKDWLAVKSFEFLKSEGVTLSDCLEFRSLSKQIKRERNGIYVNNLWKSEVSKEIFEELKPGMLLVEVSDLYNSELKYLPNISSYTTLEQEGNKLNLLNTFDFDTSNRFLLDILPEDLRLALLENKEIFLNINPYLEENTDTSSLIEEMKMYGYNKKHLSNIFYKCLFRIIRLKQEYNLTNLKIGIYGPTSIFNEDKYKEFYNFFRSNFDFNRGICFDPKVVGVKTKESYLSYTIWECKRHLRGKSVVLTEKVQHTEDTILVNGKRLMRNSGSSLYDWCNKTSKKNTDLEDGKEVPTLMNISTFSDKKVVRKSNVLGYILSSSNMFRLLKKVGITNLPMGEHQEITEENFWQCVASHSVRVCLESKFSENPIMLVSPDMSVDGYTQWLADSLILFLFSPSTMMVSYRQPDFRLENKLFPLSKKDVRGFIKDENILKDLESEELSNSFILERLKEVEHELSKEAMELYIFGKTRIKDSLRGLERAKLGYKNNLIAWDAGLYQIRGVESIFGIEEENRYIYLLNQLKSKLDEGVYNYGFIAVDKDIY